MKSWLSDLDRMVSDLLTVWIAVCKQSKSLLLLSVVNNWWDISSLCRMISDHFLLSEKLCRGPSSWFYLSIIQSLFKKGQCGVLNLNWRCIVCSLTLLSRDWFHDLLQNTVLRLSSFINHFCSLKNYFLIYGHNNFLGYNVPIINTLALITYDL